MCKNFQQFLNFLSKIYILYHFTTNKCWFSDLQLFSALLISNHWSAADHKESKWHYWQYYCTLLVTLSAVPYYTYLIMQWIFIKLIFSFENKNLLKFKVQFSLCFNERNGPNGARWKLIPNRFMWAPSAIATSLRSHFVACLVSKSCSSFLSTFL